MVLSILIAFLSLIGLLILHEFGHFVLAKHFGVKVEEFGIGYPPRIFGKKWGETIYSLNLLPFGAFVKIYGEERRVEDSRSFSSKPVWQRAIIVLGGVVTFWIIAFFLLTIVAGKWGLPIAIEDEVNHNFKNPKVQIIGVSPGSPAEKEGIQVGDIIQGLESQGFQLKTDKIKEVVEFIEGNSGQEIILTIQRGKEILKTSLVPRVSPPEEEGPIGVELARIALKQYRWYQAPIQGIVVTGRITVIIPRILGNVLGKVIRGEPVKEKIELRGPIGAGELIGQAAQQGINYFLYFIAMISIHIALFNVLPIPAVDGGKLLFLGIEKVSGKPLNQKIEQNINTFFFLLLITLMVFVTIKDITRLFLK